ncbi:hypothetical protein CENA302_02950 [Cylindrospermopsis raciborskii CENA302]|uniref:HEPN AbiU2-like domain-containing protein n=1 Tax=Cylindrospermopsis raciborskii CENA302 TaxID=1170768 RepID=A0A9Q5QZD0_9CYAN|nr:hypothetical protein CENA302_02950 [Cylindrospermopsis raciborskii CENA302]
MSDQSSASSRTPFEILQFRVAEAYWIWKVWKQLYMVGQGGIQEAEERMDVLNRFGVNFFRMLKGSLLQDVILRVCKWTDPEATQVRGVERPNLSLANALANAKSSLTPEQACKAEALLKKFKSVTPGLVQRRHWLYAHDDFNVATGKEDVPKVSDTDVDIALQCAVDLMTVLDPKSADVEFGYGETIAIGDGNSIVEAMRYAKRWVKHCRRYGRALDWDGVPGTDEKPL